MGRGEVRGRAWESRETGNGGGIGRGEAKSRKGERAKGVCPSDPVSELIFGGMGGDVIIWAGRGGLKSEAEKGLKAETEE